MESALVKPCTLSLISHKTFFIFSLNIPWSHRQSKKTH